MAIVLKRIFNVRSDEYAVFAAFFAFYFLIGIQFSLGLAVSEALFLSEVGPGFLPYMYIFNAFIIILVSMVYSSFTDKFSIPAMFKIVLFAFTAFVLAVRLGISADIRAWGMPVAVPFLHTLFVMFTNMVPNNFRSFYGLYIDVLQAKRLVPIILTGGRYGGIIGGFSIPILVSVTGSVANLLYIWIGAIFASVFFIAAIQVRLNSYILEAPETGRKKPASKPSGRSRGNLNLLKTNRYVAAFALFSFLVIFLRSFQDYQYSVVFREVYPDRAQLASFLGLFTGIASAISLLIQTFITPRLIRRLGLGTANLIYPLTTLLGLAGMIITPSFYPAVYLRFNNKNLQESIRNPINSLLYNALPTNIRSRVGALMAGQVIALASILSGVILLIIKPTGLALLPLSPRWLAFLSFLIAGGYIGAGFLLRREYGAALRKMLEDRNLGLFRFAQEGFGAINQENVPILVENIHQGDNDLCIYAARMLVDSKYSGITDEILSELPKRNRTTRCALIRLLAQVDAGDDSGKVRALWDELFQSDEPEILCAVMDAISSSPQLIDDYGEQLQECLRFPSPIVRARAIQLLVRSDDLFWLASGLQTLHAMLETERAEEKICALQCIGALENPRFVRRVIPYLTEADVGVREAAMEAAEHLIPAHVSGQKYLDEIVQTALKDTHPAIRRRGIHFLGRRGTHPNFERLLAALSDPDSTVRHEAVVSLKEMKGRGTLNLEGGALFSLMGRWLAPSRNGDATEINEEEFIEGLTEFSLEHLREIYEIVNHLHTIEQIGEGGPLVMFRKVLGDKVRDLQGLILELLGVIGDEKTVDTVSESLARGERSSRAIAIETLSNVSAIGNLRQLILMLEPLLLGGPTADILAEGRKVWDLHPVEFGRVLQIHMGSLDPWTRAIAVNAAGHFLAEDQSILLAEKGTLEDNRKEWILRFVSLARDEDSYVREAAVTAMGLMGLREKSDRKSLETALSDPNDQVRLQARRAVKRIESLADSTLVRAEKSAREMLSTIEKALFLRSVSLFESMTANHLKILSDVSREIHYPAGAVLFNEGDPCDYLYVIIDGEIEILRNPGTSKEILLAVLKRPSSFGEIALFGVEGRSAAARAKTNATLLGIEKDPLLLLIKEFPEISIAIIFQLTAIIRSQDEARAASLHDNPD